MLLPKNTLNNGENKMSSVIFFTIKNVNYYLCDVFLEYEQPELFTVSDAIGSKFLVMFVDAENNKWLMLPISAAKLLKVEYGEITIKEAFIHPEINVKIIHYINGIYHEEIIAVNDIQDDYLPLDDACLNWDNLPMPIISDDLIHAAAARQKDIFDIRVISEETRDHTINAKKFGALLIAAEEAIKSIATVRNRKAGIKRGLTAGCSLRYIGNYAGSFGIRLEGEDSSDLLDESRLTPVLNELFQMLEITDLADISRLVKEKSFEYISALRRLLKYSSDNNAALDFSYSTPRARYHGQAVWNSDFSKSTLKYLDQLISEEVKSEEYIGNLVSVSAKTNNFQFETETEEIKGKIDPSLKETEFIVKSHAKIKVQKTIKITNANEIEEKFRLISYERLPN